MWQKINHSRLLVLKVFGLFFVAENYMYLKKQWISLPRSVHTVFICLLVWVCYMLPSPVELFPVCLNGFFPLFKYKHNDKSKLRYEMCFAGKWPWWIWCRAGCLLYFKVEELYLILGAEEKTTVCRLVAAPLLIHCQLGGKYISIFSLFFRPDISMNMALTISTRVWIFVYCSER